VQILLLILIGLAAGMLSGLVGVGGGIILVPAMVYFFSYSQHQAQGTSLGVLSLPVVLLAFLTYYYQCRKMGTPISITVVCTLAVGFIAGAFLGSRIAVNIDKDVLRKIFGLILLYTAIKMMGWDIFIMRWFRNIF
jgi:uncharacterized protein